MRTVDMDFQNVPLKQAVIELGDQAGIAITLNNAELDSLGVAADSPIQAVGVGLTLRESLRQILKNYDLGYRVHESDIEITSLDDVNSSFDVRVYDLASLGSGHINMTQVVMVIARTVEPDQWRDYGGTGNAVIRIFGSALVVAAPESAHDGIVDFLTRMGRLPKVNHNSDQDTLSYSPSNQPWVSGSMRGPAIQSAKPQASLPQGFQYQLVRWVKKAGNSKAKTGDKVKTWATPTGEKAAWPQMSHSSNKEEIFVRMRNNTSVEFNNVPLRSALEELFQRIETQFWIDSNELDSLGVATDTPVTLQMSDTPWISIVQRLLKPLDLTVRINDNGVEVTSVDVAEGELTGRVYDVAALTTVPIDMNLLASTIASAVTPDEWQDYGGTGCSVIMSYGSLLLVTAPSATLFEVEAVLSQIAKMHPDNLPRPVSREGYEAQVVVKSIPGGSVIELPTDGLYEIQIVDAGGMATAALAK